VQIGIQIALPVQRLYKISAKVLLPRRTARKFGSHLCWCLFQKKRGGCSFQLSNAAQKFADWEAVFIDVSQAVEPNIDALARVFTTELG